MRGPFVIVLVVLFALGIGAGIASNRGFLGNMLSQRHSVPSPLSACTQVDEEQATRLAETLVDALNRLDPAPIGEVIDIETLFGLSIHELQLSTRERRDFLRGAADAAKQKNPLAERWMTDLAENDRARLLRIAVVDGHQHAMVRLLLGDTITYIDLVIARTPAGQVRVVDFFDVATGELFSRTLTTILLPTLANMTKTPLERLIEGSRNEALLEPKKLQEVRAKVDEGKAEEAMTLFLALPESFRTTRIGMMLRTRIAQGIDDQQYLAAMNEVEKRFPGDPSLSLLLIDANILRMRYPQALAAVDRVDETVGGDPHLDAIRANILVLTGDLEQAAVAANRACEREPGLVDNWWSLVTVSLKADTHARTAELLDHLRQRFAIEFGDLADIPEYARFAASPEHAGWLARQPGPLRPKPVE